MPDIQLRFHKDMLVLSAPVDAALAARGFTEERERELLLVTEPESIYEPMRLDMMACAQCLVLPTAGITRARLAHVRAEDNAAQIAEAALALAAQFKPQHVFAEIGSTGLPIDSSNNTTLKANQAQYADAAAAFGEGSIDAFFLNGMASIDDLRCGLEGVHSASELPVLVSVDVDAEGKILGRNEGLDHALFIAEEYGAAAVGIQTDAAPAEAAALVGRIAERTSLPILVQLRVREVCERDLYDASNPYWHADFMMQAADMLRRAGAQFLRATGAATATYTAALVAASSGLPVLGRS